MRSNETFPRPGGLSPRLQHLRGGIYLFFFQQLNVKGICALVHKQSGQTQVFPFEVPVLNENGNPAMDQYSLDQSRIEILFQNQEYVIPQYLIKKKRKTGEKNVLQCSLKCCNYVRLQQSFKENVSGWNMTLASNYTKNLHKRTPLKMQMCQFICIS